MKHGTMEQALSLTIITLVIFGFLACVAFVVAWKRRRDKGHYQILARRGAILGGTFLALSPLCFIGALWVNVTGSPFYIHRLSTAQTVTSTLSWITSALFLCAVLCSILVIRAVLMEAKERRDMIKVRQPYTDKDPDGGS